MSLRFLLLMITGLAIFLGVFNHFKSQRAAEQEVLQRLDRSWIA